MLTPLVLVALLALAMACAQYDLHPLHRAFWRRRRALSVSMGGLLMVGMGLSWSALWPLLASTWGALLLALLLGVVGIALLRAWVAQADAPLATQAPGLAVAGALLWAPATLVPTAGVQSPLLWLILVLLGLSSTRGVSWRGRSVLLLTLVVALLTYPVRIVDYVPQPSPTWERVATQLGVTAPIALFALAVAVATRLRSLPAVLLGCLLAALLERSADGWFIVPCALVLPLTFTALCAPSWFDAACLLMPASCWFFFQRDATALTQVAAVLTLWASLPRGLEGRTPLLRGAAWVLLIWLGLWTSMRTRMGGVDFDFYFRWLPHDAPATSQALQQGALTAVKCMLPVFFGVLLAHRSGARLAEVIGVAEHLTRVRLALTLLFLLGVSISRAEDVHLLYDATQEAAFWMLSFAVLGLVSLAHSLAARREARCAARSCQREPSSTSTLKA